MANSPINLQLVIAKLPLGKLKLSEPSKSSIFSNENKTVFVWFRVAMSGKLEPESLQK